MAKIYYEKEAKLSYLKGKTIAVIGFGSQGHAQSQNLKESGLDVIVSDVPNSKNWNNAKKAKMKVMKTADAAKKADVIQIVIPDTIQAAVYKKDIEPYLKPGDVLVFAHGFNIRYKQITPPDFVDVIMVAPKGPGHLVRSEYQEGRGVPALIAVEQDYSKKAKQIALAFAKGIGAARAGMLQTTFAEETETDLFGEQTVLCGGLTSLIKAGFETLVEAGYQPEIAYFECLHEMKLITDMVYEGGIQWMRYSVSDTAEYGDLKVGPKIIGASVKKEMKGALKRIQNGQFAKEWMKEWNVNKCKNFKALEKKDEGHLIEKVGAKLRKMMPWIKRRQTEIGKK